MIESIKYAFSMYSIFPCGIMTEKQAAIGRKGMLFAFPLIGIVIGVLQFLVFEGCRFLGLSCYLAGALLTAIPVFMTGGIHVDGYLDVCDAIGSWGSIEKKRQILKDSHVGGAAVVHCVIYFLLMYGAYCQMYMVKEEFAVWCFALLTMILVLERCLTAYMVMSQPKASDEGMAAQAAKDAKSKGGILVVFQFLLLTGMMLLSVFKIGYWVLALLVGFAGARWLGFSRMKSLGGMSGDVAGYTLQVVELSMVVILSVIVTVL